MKSLKARKSTRRFCARCGGQSADPVQPGYPECAGSATSQGMNPDRLSGGESVTGRYLSLARLSWFILISYSIHCFPSICILGLLTYLQKYYSNKDIVAECLPGNIISWGPLLKVGFTPTYMRGSRPGRFLFRDLNNHKQAQ